MKKESFSSFIWLQIHSSECFLHFVSVWVILKPRKLKHIFSSLHHVTIKENKMKVHVSFSAGLSQEYF